MRVFKGDYKVLNFLAEKGDEREKSTLILGR